MQSTQKIQSAKLRPAFERTDMGTHEYTHKHNFVFDMGLGILLMSKLCSIYSLIECDAVACSAKVSREKERQNALMFGE